MSKIRGLTNYLRLQTSLLNQPPMRKLTTTYPTLDQFIGPGGFRSPMFGLLAARPSVGKTSFAINILRRMQGPRAMLSLEMNLNELNEQLKKQPIQDPNDLLLTDQVFSLKDIEGVFAEFAGKVPFVVIDYVNLIQLPGGGSLDNSSMSIISRTLRMHARRAGISLLALAQLNRACEQRADPRPKLSDLRESGTLEQDADLVMFLFSEKYYRPDDASASDDLEVHLAKQRMGRRGVTVFFNFDRETCNITDGGAARKPYDSAEHRQARQQREHGMSIAAEALGTQL